MSERTGARILCGLGGGLLAAVVVFCLGEHFDPYASEAVVAFWNVLGISIGFIAGYLVGERVTHDWEV